MVASYEHYVEMAIREWTLYGSIMDEYFLDMAIREWTLYGITI